MTLCVTKMVCEYAMIDDDEFEVFNVLRFNSPIPTLSTEEATGLHVIYIDKFRYDQELLCGQEHVIAAYAQFAKGRHEMFLLYERPSSTPT